MTFCIQQCHQFLALQHVSLFFLRYHNRSFPPPFLYMYTSYTHHTSILLPRTSFLISIFIFANFSLFTLPFYSSSMAFCKEVCQSNLYSSFTLKNVFISPPSFCLAIYIKHYCLLLLTSHFWTLNMLKNKTIRWSIHLLFLLFNHELQKERATQYKAKHIYIYVLYIKSYFFLFFKPNPV